MEAVRVVFNAMTSEISTVANELLLTEGPYLYYIYLQEYICNFGFEFTVKI